MIELLPAYLGWHYTRGFLGIFTVGGNLLWFTAHFFSVPLLLRTLLAPWKRVQDRGAEGDIEDFFASLLVNMLSRLIGCTVRSVVILAGLLALFLALLGLLGAILLWLAAPLIAVASVAFGITLLS